MKLIQLLKETFKKPAPLNECVVAAIKLNGDLILAKNRDRAYDPTIKIIHELMNDIEVVYLYDEITDYSEGMNEYGIGVINASLMVAEDEAQGLMTADKDKKGPVQAYDGTKIRHALANKKLSEAVRSIIAYQGIDPKEVGVKGETIVSSPKHTMIVELTSKHLPVITRMKPETKVVVRTNHGIYYKDAGYTSGPKRASSISRREIAEEELEDVKDESQILPTLSQSITTDNYNNPYRTDNKFGMNTTSQIKMNLTELTFELRYDDEHSKFEGYENKLPKGYEPKIKVKFGETGLHH
jgi:protein-tyrosine-phosphatase